MRGAILHATNMLRCRMMELAVFTVGLSSGTSEGSPGQGVGGMDISL